jgi:hypothetical protein
MRKGFGVAILVVLLSYLLIMPCLAKSEDKKKRVDKDK